MHSTRHTVQVEMMRLEVDAMQAEAASARAAAEASQAAVTEVERLGQDNALLAARLAQMDTDLQVIPPPSCYPAPDTWLCLCLCLQIVGAEAVMAGLIAESQFYTVEWLCAEKVLTLPGRMHLC